MSIIHAMRQLFLIALFLPSFIFGQTDRGLTPTAASQKTSTGRYHAIIISVNQYRDEMIKDLDEPKRDADKLYGLLSTKYYFKPEDMIRLVDPSRADILDAIEQKRNSLSVDDNLIIFYAGHGHWDEGLKMGYWLPSDSKKESRGNWISNTDLTLYLAALQSKHVLLISDACFSGGIFKTRSLGNMDQGTSRLYQLKSRKALTSGNMKEVPDQSVFMRYFIKELEINQAMFVSSDQLFAKIRPNILNNSNTEPLYGVIFNTGDEGGEFIFYNQTSTAAATTPDNTALVSSIKDPNKRSVVSPISEGNKKLDNPKRVAIISFDNTTGKMSEYGDLGGPLRDMLTTDLKEVKNLTMVDRQALEKVLSEQQLNNSKSFDPATATKIGKLLGAEVIITGTYFEFFGSLRVDAKFISVETGEIAFSVGVDGAREKFLDLKNSLANKIIEKLKN